MNDPVGMRWHRGEWHLFFQASPAIDGSAMGWGHAVSEDRLRWTARPPILAADASGLAWSGSVCPDPDGALIAFHTRHDPATGQEQQAAARETAEGLWEPVPLSIGEARPGWRDPFVFAHGSGWRMLLAEPIGWQPAPGARSKLALYRSADLRQWARVGVLPVGAIEGELLEMPALCCLAPDCWLLLAGVVDRSGAGAPCHSRAWLGLFDGDAFAPRLGPIRLDHGPDFYAAGPWGSLPPFACELTAWLNSWDTARSVPGKSWSGGVHSLPRRLSLVGDRLLQHPAADPAEGWAEREAELSAGASLAPGDAARLRLGLAPGTGFMLGCGAVELAVTAATDELRVARTAQADVPGFAGEWRLPWSGAALTLFLDRASVEIFLADGTATASFLLPFSQAPLLHVVSGSVRAHVATIGEAA